MTLKLEHGKSYRGESGTVHKVINNDNVSWPFKTADCPHEECSFWDAFGARYNASGWNSNATKGDDLVAEVPQFAVGDRVRATRSCAGITKGETYVVTRVDSDSAYMPIAVRDDVGDNYWLDVDQFEPVAGQPDNPLPRALLAASATLAIIAALYHAPWVVGAFLAGVLTAIWFAV